MQILLENKSKMLYKLLKLIKVCNYIIFENLVTALIVKNATLCFTGIFQFDVLLPHVLR